MSKPGFFDENSTQFKEELEASEQYRQQVGRFLCERGVRVEVPPMEYRKDLSDRDRFKNEKDIIAWPGVADHEMVVIEVKSRNEKFTSAEDFGRTLRRKYGESDIFVDTVHGWAQKDPKPKLICMVSTETGAMIALPGKTEEHWKKRTKGDSTRGYVDTFYTAEPEFFITMEEAVEKILKMQAKYSPRRSEYGRVKRSEQRLAKTIARIEAVLNSEEPVAAIEEILSELPR